MIRKKIIVKRKIPEPNYETLEFGEDEVKEDEFYIIEEHNLNSFQNFILTEECKNTTATYIVDIYRQNTDNHLKDALLQLKLSKQNLLGYGPNILETSKERKLDGIICSSIKSILVRPFKLEKGIVHFCVHFYRCRCRAFLSYRKLPVYTPGFSMNVNKEFSETTDKVKVKGEEDVVPLWRRMLMTIDGLGEPEVEAVLEIIPSYEALEDALDENSDKLFENMCQAKVIRGTGALERSQRLGPKLAQRIINTFDESSADFILD